MAVAAAAQWIANSLVTVSFPVSSQDVSLTFAYGLYATFAALSFVFVLTKVSETKGRELESMTDEVRQRRRRADRT